MPGTMGPALRRWVQDIGDGACAQAAKSCFRAGCSYGCITAWLCLRRVAQRTRGQLCAGARLLMSFFAEDAELELWDLLTCHRTAT